MKMAVVITTPFHPGYISAARIAAAPKLKLALTAGVGSDHVDLPAARAAGLIVAEVTGCNVVSVAEHVVMQVSSAASSSRKRLTNQPITH